MPAFVKQLHDFCLVEWREMQAGRELQAQEIGIRISGIDINKYSQVFVDCMNTVGSYIIWRDSVRLKSKGVFADEVQVLSIASSQIPASLFLW